jgi:hypothetical protein
MSMEPMSVAAGTMYVAIMKSWSSRASLDHMVWLTLGFSRRRRATVAGGTMLAKEARRLAAASRSYAEHQKPSHSRPDVATER